MSEDAEIRGVIPNYYAFMIEKLNRIFDAEARNNYPLALELSLKLTKYLPRKLKKQILEETTRIKKRLENEANVTGYFHSQMKREMQTKLFRIALQEEDAFVDRITSLLDSEHLLTQSYGIPTRSRGMDDIQRTVDKARFESGE